MRKPIQFEEPSPSEKAAVEKLARYFLYYFSTSEGIEEGERLSVLVKKWEDEQAVRFDSLFDTEKSALKFIAIEIMNGRKVTVRAVACAIGFTSSRSGAVVIDNLISKRFLARGTDGGLEVV